MAIVQTVVGSLALTAAVFAIAAGVAELRYVFPEQELSFVASLIRDPDDPSHQGFTVRVRAASAMINKWKVDATITGGRFWFSGDDPDSRARGEWVGWIDPDSGACALVGQGYDLFPNESNGSPSVQTDRDILTIDLKWWTDRRGQEDISTVVTWDESKTHYDSQSNALICEVQIPQA